MKELFKNNYKKDKDLIKEIYFYLYFKRPFRLIINIIAILNIIYLLSIYKYSPINTTLIIFIYFIFFILEIISYKKMVNIQFKRDLELNRGKVLEVNTIVTENTIQLNSSNNENAEISFDKIKKGFQTKNLICLMSEAKLIYTFKKDSFTKGTSDDFIKFIREKSIKL